jgi:hypothetical protein
VDPRLLGNRTPAELRIWLDENEIARELIAYITDSRAAHLQGMIAAARGREISESNKCIGAYDALGKILNRFEQEKK